MWNKSYSVCSKLLFFFLFIFCEIPKIKELGLKTFLFHYQSINKPKSKKNQIIHKLSQIITHQYHHGHKWSQKITHPHKWSHIITIITNDHSPSYPHLSSLLFNNHKLSQIITKHHSSSQIIAKDHSPSYHHLSWLFFTNDPS